MQDYPGTRSSGEPADLEWSCDETNPDARLDCCGEHARATRRVWRARCRRRPGSRSGTAATRENTNGMQPADDPRSLRVLGIKMHPGKPRSIPSGQGLTSDRCDWESTEKRAGGISGTPLQFNVVTFTGKGAREQLDGLLAKDDAAGIEYHAVPELGKNAVYEVPTHSLAMLSSDTRLLIVRINPTTLDTTRVDLEAEDVTVAASRLAVKRLEKP